MIWFAIVWYISGVVSWLLFCYYCDKSITIGDLTFAILISGAAGLLVAVALIVFALIYSYEKSKFKTIIKEFFNKRII